MDLARDVTAFLLLLMSLFVPWDVRGSTADHWWALMPVLLTIVGISVSHIARVLPVTPVVVQLAKLAAVAPLLLAVAVTVAREALRMVGVGDGGGIGGGVALALAGAMLVAQPRAAEDLPGRAWDQLWWSLTGLLAAGAVALSLVTWLWFLVDDLGLDFVRDNTSFLPSFVHVLVASCWWWGCRWSSRRGATRPVRCSWSVLAAEGPTSSPRPRHRAAYRDRRGRPLGRGWLGSAPRRDAAGPRGGVLVLDMLLHQTLPGAVLRVALLSLVGGGLLLAGWTALGAGAPVVTLAATAVVLVLGIVVVAVRETAEVFGYSGVDAIFVLSWFVLPGDGRRRLPAAAPGRAVGRRPGCHGAVGSRP